ncbi:MAG: prepilin-type N-terminal cleavage/methylation domain-containing protein, partial [Planctomycetia bacterium]|nr:prepilin-type N-terminal cleavage/methylation domain-containing protein [Planctomycetia bacterium]
MKRRFGLTLIEMLVATALTLLLVGALTQAFQIVGTNVASNRATLEMAGQIRGVNIRLQSDLANVTVPLKPWPRPSEGLGYFEYIEGWDHDGSPYLLGNTNFGDNDDVGLYTDYAAATPTPTTITSPLAEIAWWATLTDKPVTDVDQNGLLDTGNGSVDPDQGEDFTLYRRVLLIRPDLGTLAQFPPPTSTTPNPTYNINTQADLLNLRTNIRQFYGENDVSVRIVRNFIPAGSNNLQVFMVANSLEDLTKRENRFAHSRIVADNPSAAPWTPGVPPPGRQRVALRYYSATFPHHLDRDYTSATSLPTLRI